jgi:hypothetical protein
LGSRQFPIWSGDLTRKATGSEDEELRGYGDPSPNAEAMALKRVASKFGLGLYLYSKLMEYQMPGRLIVSSAASVTLEDQVIT